MKKLLTNKKIRWSIILTSVLLIGTIRFVHVDAFKVFYFPCSFHKYTGLYCPGCGSSRAMNAMLHLDILKALSHNIMVVIFLPVIIYWAIAESLEVYWNKKLPRPHLSKQLIMSIFWTFIAFWILRNLPIAPFTCLAP